MKQKYYLALTTEEWRLMIEPLNNLRNRLVSEGRYTDAVDKVLSKAANRDMGAAAPLLSQGASPCAICQPSDRR